MTQENLLRRDRAYFDQPKSCLRLIKTNDEVTSQLIVLWPKEPTLATEGGVEQLNTHIGTHPHLHTNIDILSYTQSHSPTHARTHTHTMSHTHMHAHRVSFTWSRRVLPEMRSLNYGKENTDGEMKMGKPILEASFYQRTAFVFCLL